MRLSLLEILEATGGGEVGGTQVGNTFSTFHTDSRELGHGGVFFALRGAKMDGHRFVDDAIKRGATAVVVQRRMEVPTGIAEIRVPDTWAALFALASYTLGHISPLVVGVTGSNGKTSTKEMIAAILSKHYNVMRTSGNLNTETGVPLTMVALQPHHTAVVLEMGMQRPGDIARLVALARPTIGVITNIGTVHMEFFSSREELALSKGEMVAGLTEHDTAILNADDQFFPMLVSVSAARVRSFGMATGDFRADGYRALTGGGGQFSVRGIEVGLALDGRHQAVNAVAALAAGVTAGVTLQDGADALANAVSYTHLRAHETRH